jgi:iron complex transport system substrate-binding protein
MAFRRGLGRPAAVLAALLALSAPAGAQGIVIHDGSGRDVAVGSALRVVSIGGALTEIVYALGEEGRVIAVDSTSLWPPEAAAKPDVGYMRALSAEGVLSVAPDLILAVEGSGPAEAMDALKAAAIPIVIVPDRYTPEGIG